VEVAILDVIDAFVGELSPLLERAFSICWAKSVLSELTSSSSSSSLSVSSSSSSFSMLAGGKGAVL